MNLTELKALKTEEAYEEALKAFEQYMLSRPVKNTNAFNEMEHLSNLIREYEEKHFPSKLPDPISYIKFVMEQRHLAQDDLVPLIGSKKKVMEVLSGKCNLSIQMMRKLNKHLGIPAEILLQKKNAELPE